MNSKRVLEIIENKEWMRLIKIAEAELNLKQSTLMDFNPQYGVQMNKVNNLKSSLKEIEELFDIFKEKSIKKIIKEIKQDKDLFGGYEDKKNSTIEWDINHWSGKIRSIKISLEVYENGR